MTSHGNRIVFGQIKWCENVPEDGGKPAVGVKVTAWDADVLPPPLALVQINPVEHLNPTPIRDYGDDLMGTDITDSNGDYIIHYDGGWTTWDWAPHKSGYEGVWRPDIYIRVEVGGKQVIRSDIAFGHPMREAKQIDLCIEPPPEPPPEPVDAVPATGTTYTIRNRNRFDYLKYLNGFRSGTLLRCEDLTHIQ